MRRHRVVVSDEPLRLQLRVRDDHGKRTGIRGGMATMYVNRMFSSLCGVRWCRWCLHEYFCQGASGRCSRKSSAHLVRRFSALPHLSNSHSGSTPPWVRKRRKRTGRSARGRQAMAWAMSKSRARTFTGMLFWRIHVSVGKTNRHTDLQRRSRSSSASLTARLSAMPRETSPKLHRTSRVRRPLPASSPTGSGSTTPVSSRKMPSSRSAPRCRPSLPTRRRIS